MEYLLGGEVSGPGGGFTPADAVSLGFVLGFVCHPELFQEGIEKNGHRIKLLEWNIAIPKFKYIEDTMCEATKNVQVGR